MRGTRCFAATLLVLVGCSDPGTGNQPGVVTDDADTTINGDGIDDAPPPDAYPETFADAEPEIVADAEPETVTDAAPETVTDVAPETVTDAAPETVTDVAPETVTDVEPETVADVEPETATDIVPDTTTDVAPDTGPDVVPDCSQVTKIGCCDGEVLWACVGGSAVATDCTGAESCGWSAAEGGYACGTAGEASPDGSYEKDCPWVCTPDCEGKTCGDDGCGGSCGSCGDSEVCGDQGVCIGEPECAEVTKLGRCEGETLWVCEGGEILSQSCAGSPSCGWDAGVGGYACGTAGDASPDGAAKDCDWMCYPDCAGKDCGDDGCGGSCGECSPTDVCAPDGTCCVPECGGAECGGDGCGGSCGTCAAGEVCAAGGTCVAACGDCTGKQCGADGCGGTCGSCAGGEICTSAGQCVTSCTPDCGGKQCGDDGCGGSCGDCGFFPGQYCSPEGLCTSTCTPSCGAAECGDDGCGGSCGDCDPGVLCTVGGVCGNACLECNYEPECLNYGFEIGNLAGWQLSGEAKVVDSFGATVAPEGGYMVDLSNTLDNEGRATTQTCVPDTTTGIRFYWKFYSEEFLEYCGSQFADYFRVTVNGQVVFERTIDDLCGPTDGSCQPGACGANAVPLTPSDVSFDQGGVFETGWQYAFVPLDAFVGDPSGATLDIAFAVGDSGDSIFDSHALIDGITLVTGCTPTDCGGACDDGCGGACVLCPASSPCQDGTCGGGTGCVPDCAGAECGADGCGGSCGACAVGEMCDAGSCVGAPGGSQGTPCTDTSECASGLECWAPPFPGTDPTICTEGCDPFGTDTCPTGFVCTPGFGGGSSPGYCYPSP